MPRPSRDNQIQGTTPLPLDQEVIILLKDDQFMPIFCSPHTTEIIIYVVLSITFRATKNQSDSRAIFFVVLVVLKCLKSAIL